LSEQPPRARPVHLPDLGHETLGAGTKLGGPGLEIHHAIAVNLAEPRERGVVMVLSASLVAVPALSRVEPASTSGPTRSAITRLAAPRGTSGLHVTSTDSAPRRRASASAARTNGVTPLAAMPTTASLRRARRRVARAPARASSSAPSTERNTAPR